MLQIASLLGLLDRFTVVPGAVARGRWERRRGLLQGRLRHVPGASRSRTPPRRELVDLCGWLLGLLGHWSSRFLIPLVRTPEYKKRGSVYRMSCTSSRCLNRGQKLHTIWACWKLHNSLACRSMASSFSRHLRGHNVFIPSLVRCRLIGIEAVRVTSLPSLIARAQRPESDLSRDFHPAPPRTLGGRVALVESKFASSST